MEQKNNNKKFTRLIILFLVILIGITVFFIFNKQKKTESINKLSVYYLDVGQGDCSIIHFPNNKVMQIDAGVSGAFRINTGEKIVLPFYKKLGIEKLDIAVITHPDLDHIGGYVSILKDLPTGELWDSMFHTTKAYKSILETVKEKNINYFLGYELINKRLTELNKQNYFGDSVYVQLLGPLKDYGERNANSNCLKITYKNISFFFGGDATKKSQQDMSEKWEEKILDSDIMIAPHHGSPHNYYDKFIEAINPEITIVSTGPNPYGHPDQKIIENYKKIGAKVYRTDKTNAHIVVETDGDTYNLALISHPKEEKIIINETQKLNINTAEVNTFKKIKGIGNYMATQIVNHREKNGEFQVITDIVKVSGLGWGTYDKIKDLIAVNDSNDTFLPGYVFPEPETEEDETEE